MNLYQLIGSRVGTADALALSGRLAAWHDAMVAHERRLRTSQFDVECDEECPHAEARMLWAEAVMTFGAPASELSFLRSRAVNVKGGAAPSASRSMSAGGAGA